MGTKGVTVIYTKPNVKKTNPNEPNYSGDYLNPFLKWGE